MQKVILTTEQTNTILTYLGSRPYIETVKLIEIISKAVVEIEEEKPALPTNVDN